MQNNRLGGEPRHEQKYFIGAGDYARLSSLLYSVLPLDAHADERGEYFIRSIYFDDAFDSAYYQKMDGIEDREKYRIRIYNCSDAEIFLERKRKQGQYVSKASVRITRRLCDQLLEGRPDGLEKAANPLLRDTFRMMRTRLLRPKVIVDYYREAYVHPAESTRVTFDKRLRTGMYSRELFDKALYGVPPIPEDTVILEVKFNRYLPEYVRELLRSVRGGQCSISKYALCRGYEPLGE